MILSSTSTAGAESQNLNSKLKIPSFQGPRGVPIRPFRSLEKETKKKKKKEKEKENQHAAAYLVVRGDGSIAKGVRTVHVLGHGLS